MTPWQLAKETEHSHQRAFFAFLNCAKEYGFTVACNKQGYSLATRFTPRADGLVDKYAPVLELAYCFAIPNGGSRGDDAKTRAIRGGQMKAEGVRAGAPDVMLPVTLGFAGLFLEFKKPSAKPKREGAGGVREKQTDYHAFLRAQQYRVEVVYSWIEAANIVMDYMGYRGKIND